MGQLGERVEELFPTLKKILMEEINTYHLVNIQINVIYFAFMERLFSFVYNNFFQELQVMSPKPYQDLLTRSGSDKRHAKLMEAQSTKGFYFNNLSNEDQDSCDGHYKNDI